MPIYEFHCPKCSDSFEKLTSVSRVSEVVCPKCGSKDVKRLLSSFCANVKGGGSSSSGGGCAGCSSGNCSSCK